MHYGSHRTTLRGASTAALVAIVATVTAQAAAQPVPSPPTGWTMSASQAGLSYQSPGTAAGSASVLIAPLHEIAGDFISTFAEDVPALVEDLFGEPINQGPAKDWPSKGSGSQALSSIHLVRSTDGTEIRVQTIGYPLPQGTQLVFIVLPADLPLESDSVKQALRLTESLRAGPFALTPDVLTTALASGVAQLRAGVVDDDGNATAAQRLPDNDPDNPDERIEAVIYYLRLNFDGQGSVGDAELAPITATLLKDGHAFEREASAPASLDPSKRPDGAGGVGRWEKDGEGYLLTFTDGESGTAVSSAAKTFAAPAAMTFDGTYIPSGGSTAAGGWAGSLTFAADETLTIGVGTGTGGGSAASATQGRYKISQRTIEITAADGGTSSRIFGFQGDRDRPDVLLIGNRIYTRKE